MVYLFIDSVYTCNSAFIDITGLVGEFNILDENTSTQGLPYDHMSIMHPGIYAFAQGKTKTIVPLNSVHSCSTGTYMYPTTLDFFHINIMYCEGTHHTAKYIVHVRTCMFATSI